MDSLQEHQNKKFCNKNKQTRVQFNLEPNQQSYSTQVQEQTEILSNNQILQQQQEIKIPSEIGIQVNNTPKQCNIEVQDLKQEMIQNQENFKYELIFQFEKKIKYYCQSFAFNNANSLVIIAFDCTIKIYEFINGKIGKKLQVLKNYHTDSVLCLYFMKQSNCFVSGGRDCRIFIWKQLKNNEWFAKQKLTNHKFSVYCLLMNKTEDLLISGSTDSTVKFFDFYLNVWKQHQIIRINSFDQAFAMSLNEIENKLIICGQDAIIYVLKIQEDKFWSIEQKIKMDQYGFRLCFTIGDQFVFQPEKQDYLEVYDYDSISDQFRKQSQVKIQSCSNCNILFPCQFLKSSNTLFVKHGRYLNIFQINKERNYELIQTIQFSHQQYLFGTVSNDGKYLITLDKGSKEIQVRSLKLLNE